MAYVVDYSGVHAYLYGVFTGTYTTPASAATTVKCLEDVLTYSDIQGSAVGVSDGDIAFMVWGITGDAEVNSTLLVSSVTYMVLEVSMIRGDGAHQRLICRQQVS